MNLSTCMNSHVVTMQNKNNVQKKNSGKFNKFKPKFNKPTKKKHFLEDDEIKEIQEKYLNIPESSEIKSFYDFPLSRNTLRGLKQNKFKVPTDIQKQSIGPALLGKDVLGAAQTGSGKTLAFLIPILENLYLKKWTRIDGTGAIIISPTRELAYQIFETLKKVGAFHDISSGLIIGGKNLKFETKRMDQVNIVICTPGRLLQHMDENPLFNCTSLQILVLDEADRCLDMGFSTTMNAIIENLPAERQTLLFSATQTKSLTDLARLSLKSPETISVHETAETRTPEFLQQNYLVVNQEDKMAMLWSFIKNHLKNKSIVFMSSCKQVKFVYEMFSKLRPGIQLLALYGTLHQDRRMAIYDEFCKRSRVVLFATDIASRGLDFPVVSWVVQLDCPEDVTAYIHRAGRTARHKAHGESLLCLTETEEEPMLQEMRESQIPINKISIDPKRLMTPQAKMESYIAQSTELKDTAQRSFIAYLKSVYLMKNKKIFNVETVNFDAYARSLGLVVTPRVRFLQRLKKRQNQGTDDQKSSESNEESDDPDGIPKQKLKSIDLNKLMEEDSDEDAGLIRVKRINHDVDEDDNGEPFEDIVEARKQKTITKASIAKKLMKKKIKPNVKVQFDEDGNEIINTAKQLQSDLAREYEEADESGVNIEKAMEIMKEEDKFDKRRFKELVKLRHKAKKNKLKAKQSKDEDEDEEDEFESGSEPDLSWLPDYDKINKQKNQDSDVSNNGGSDSEFDDELHRPPKRLLEKKKRGKSDISEERQEVGSGSENELPVKKRARKDLSKLDIYDAEAIAMSLLN